jgi:hypothetical protein
MKALAGPSGLRLGPLLVIGELLLIAAVAFMASRRELILVLILPIGVGVVLTFLRWPSLGLVFAPLGGLVIPFLGPSGLNVTMVMVALLLSLWLLALIVPERQLELARSRTLWPLLSFLVIAVCSFGVGQLPSPCPSGCPTRGPGDHCTFRRNVLADSQPDSGLALVKLDDLGIHSCWHYICFYSDGVTHIGSIHARLVSRCGPRVLYLAGSDGTEPGHAQ